MKHLFPLQYGPLVGNVDLVANTFDCAHKAFSLVPLSTSETWHTLSAFMARNAIESTVCVFSSFTQLRSPLARVHQASGIPFFFLPPEHLKAFPELVLKLKTQSIVVTRNHLEKVLGEVSVAEIKSVKYMHVLCDVFDLPYAEKSPVHLVHEVHVVAGMPILYQCEYLAKASPNIFHKNKNVIWHTAGDCLSITEQVEAPRFAAVELPHRYTSVERMCGCGEGESVTMM